MTKSNGNSPKSTVSRRAVLAGGAALSASLFLPKNLRAQDYPTAAVNTTGLAVTGRVSELVEI